MNYNLPPLPATIHEKVWDEATHMYSDEYSSRYTAEQMREYAQAALDALADEAEASIKEMVDKGLGQLPQPDKEVSKHATIAEWHAEKTSPVAWQAVGGSIWAHKTSEDDRPLYAAPAAQHCLWARNGNAPCPQQPMPSTPAFGLQTPPGALGMTAEQHAEWNEARRASGEPNMRHPKIQALIGAKARREIELQIVEQLLDDPDCDLTSMDMEYWHGLHDKLREKLLATAQPAPAMNNGDPEAARILNDNLASLYIEDEPPAQPAASGEPVAWIEGPHGAIRMNMLWKLDPMPPQSVAWSIPLYTMFPKATSGTCTPQPAPARGPLTDAEIAIVLDRAGVPGLPPEWALCDYEIARAIEAAHGITAKEAP